MHPSVAGGRSEELGAGEARPERLRGRVHALLIARLQLLLSRMARLSLRDLAIDAGSAGEVRLPASLCFNARSCNPRALPLTAMNPGNR